MKTHDVDEFVNAVWLMSGSFGGINLEDIAAPRCFEIERKLKEKCDIPIFHDDQHGTAVITLALHHRHARLRADVPKAKHRAAVGNHRAEVVAAGQLVALVDILTLAGLTNALKVVGKKKEDVKIVTSGAGAAAVSIVKLLLSAGFRHVTTREPAFFSRFVTWAISSLIQFRPSRPA